jgi:hypothetical protein
MFKARNDLRGVLICVVVASGPAFSDDGSPPKRIEVPSGQQLRISVPKSGFRLYEGSRCRLRLTLEGGAAVESADFKP